MLDDGRDVTPFEEEAVGASRRRGLSRLGSGRGGVEMYLHRKVLLLARDAGHLGDGLRGSTGDAPRQREPLHLNAISVSITRIASVCRHRAGMIMKTNSSR